MPHLVILYTGQLEAETDMTALCRSLADTMLTVRDDADKPLFPIGGTRVLAYPAPHYAVADDSGNHAFIYMNLRMAKGRSLATQQRAGDALLACAKAHLEPVFAQRRIGMTIQVEEGAESFDGKHNNLHPLFQNVVR